MDSLHITSLTDSLIDSLIDLVLFDYRHVITYVLCSFLVVRSDAFYSLSRMDLI